MLDRIKKLRPPRIPPISMFRPIDTDWTKSMSDVEFLLSVLKKLNQVIALVNELQTTVSGFDERITNLENRFDSLIGAVEEELNSFEILFNQKLQENLSLAKTYTDLVAENLNEKIDNITLGTLELYDPTTGLLTPLQEVINNIYGDTRSDALTASEYDALDLTASAYAGYDITASQYDREGKTLLV